MLQETFSPNSANSAKPNNFYAMGRLEQWCEDHSHPWCAAEADIPELQVKSVTESLSAFALFNHAYLLGSLLRLGGKRSSVTLCDISRSGARFVCNENLDSNEEFLLILGEGYNVKARENWQNGNICGCTFQTPLSKKQITKIHL